MVEIVSSASKSGSLCSVGCWFGAGPAQELAPAAGRAAGCGREKGADGAIDLGGS